MKYLIALDLEGVAGVVGYPYEGLSQGEEYEKAIRESEKEVNAVASTLFSLGATQVFVWDNHGSGVNINFDNLDNRVTRFTSDTGNFKRLSEIAPLSLDGIFLLGYHSREGTINGVLAHTMSSKEFISHSLNGKRIGEIEQDTYLAGEYGVPVLMVVSDDKGCEQAKEFSPSVVTVVTKTGLGRNKAILRSSEEVVEELKQKTKEAIKTPVPPIRLTFPATLVVGYSRTETAETAKNKYFERTGDNAEFDGDARTVKYEVTNLFSFKVAMCGK